VARRIPLTTLLSWAWTAMTIEVDNAVESAASERVGHRFRISLPMWTNGLRLIDDDGITVDGLRARACAACNLGGLERWGWLSVGEPGGPRRAGFGTRRGITGDTVLRPTRAGAYARRLWPRQVGAVEERWRSRFGGEVVDRLRLALPVDPAMPWSPPEVHPSDGFFTHVTGGAAHDDRGATLPLVALLGAALTARTLDHETGAEVSLPLGANVMRALGTDPVRIRDLPGLTGTSKEATAMAVGYLRRRGLATEAAGRSVRLTPEGLDALDGYRHRATRSKDADLAGALEAVLARTGALAAGLVPPEGCWRGERPYRSQTERLVADPTAALPWHPIVLHRGGWPDGS
jgi:hypothetical protein